MKKLFISADIEGTAGIVNWNETERSVPHDYDYFANQMTREVAASPYSRVFFFDDPSSDRYFWKMFLAGVVLLISMTGLDQDMMQRNLSCATPRDSQKNIVLTAVSQIFVIFLFLVLGVLLYIYMDRSGLAMPEKGDQVFSQVAVNGGLPVFVGILFVVGLISSTYSAAGSALTALTTSFTVDILQGTRRYGDERLTRIRRGVHVGMAVGMALVILGFEYLADDSVINLVYKVASYTYGPILGMFAFGMFTRCRVRDRWVPFAAVAAPLLSASLQYAARVWWSYHIGFELLIYNALFTMLGMFLIDKVGRKKLIGVGAVGMFVSLVLVARGFWLERFEGYYMLVCLMGYIAFFAVSLGATIWVVISEVFPNSVRAKGQVLGSMTHWVWSALLSWFFPVFLSVGGTYIFGFFALIALGSLIFAIKLPETKDKSLEQIQKELVK